uniref:Uncharacterized protein n=1 Tax=Anguilla anguilla TaxID=7936 RepID=A0A0E9VER5_ANGAN
MAVCEWVQGSGFWKFGTSSPERVCCPEVSGQTVLGHTGPSG